MGRERWRRGPTAEHREVRRTRRTRAKGGGEQLSWVLCRWWSPQRPAYVRSGRDGRGLPQLCTGRVVPSDETQFILPSVRGGNHCLCNQPPCIEVHRPCRGRRSRGAFTWTSVFALSPPYIASYSPKGKGSASRLVERTLSAGVRRTGIQGTGRCHAACPAAKGRPPRARSSLHTAAYPSPSHTYPSLPPSPLLPIVRVVGVVLLHQHLRPRLHRVHTQHGREELCPHRLDIGEPP